MIKVVCEDQQGRQIPFEYKGNPLALVDLDGFADAEYTVNTSQASGQDGETYNGETANKRNPVITAEILSDFQAQRDKLYAFFQPRAPGTVYKYEGAAVRKATYYVEKIDIAESGPTRPVTISLICPDPLFYDLAEDITELAGWDGLIEFTDDGLEIVDDPFPLTEKVSTLIGNVLNKSNVTRGLTIKFSASGTVTNPSLYDVNRQTTMKINTTMHSGDVIIITTGQNNKRAQMVSGGVTTNISNLINYPPVWLQAYPGDNLFRYDAEDGIDNLNVSIIHRQAYWGA